MDYLFAKVEPSTRLQPVANALERAASIGQNVDTLVLQFGPPKSVFKMNSGPKLACLAAFGGYRHRHGQRLGTPVFMTPIVAKLNSFATISGCATRRQFSSRLVSSRNILSIRRVRVRASKRTHERGLSQHQVSVRCDAIHIHASRLELI